MVSWINNFVDGSGPPGGVTSYHRAVLTHTPDLVTTSFMSTSGLILASPGTVDTNAPWRAQYPIRNGSGVLLGPTFQADAAVRFDQADVDANPGKHLTLTCFVAPASAFGPGVVPTPAQIRSAATEVFRGHPPTYAWMKPAYVTAPGDVNGNGLDGVPHDGLPPNTKYWVMVCPTAVTDWNSTPPSIANDVPVGDVNVNGRAVSIWTNRTPLAPVITTPSARVTAFAGSTVDMTFVPKDPDRIASFPGDTAIQNFEDVAGVQIQYRPAPSAANPDPAWADLPIKKADGSALADGWYLDRAFGSNSGAKKMWESFRLQIRCGGTTAAVPANMGHLPSGDWQVRLRTFDYGHAFPNATGKNPPLDGYEAPLANGSGWVTPSTYPAENTSPWSTALSISVSAQVPKPLPLSPVGGVAIPEDQQIVLAWQYRNTFDPPYPQAQRTVQIRRVGESAWTTLTTDASSLSTFTIGPGTLSGYTPVSGNQYQWRVKVTDGSGIESSYSDPAQFWSVAVPGEGTVVPDPSETIDGATIGCGTHRIVIYRRGGKEYVGEIRKVSSVEWSRVRDDISTAKIVVSDWDIDCGNLLMSLQTWAYEVVIFRDNGYTTDRVWEGPITLLTYESDSVTIHAKDVMAYAYRRIIKQAMNDTGESPTKGTSVVNRAMRVLQNVLAPSDPNVLAYLHVITNDNDAKQYRSTPAYSRTGYEEVDDMAANAGLDYTAVGRAILLWGTKNRIGTLPEFRDKDLGASPIVSEYGMSMANRYAVSDGNGVYGEADRLNSDGEDPVYGPVEMLSSTWASDTESEEGTYTQEGLATVRESFAESAERSIADRYPPPVVVRVPDNTRLNPDTVISIQHLVPGVVVPLRSTSTLRSVRALQKLDSIKVTEAKGEETITITLSPFSREDNAIEGGEEG